MHYIKPRRPFLFLSLVLLCSIPFYALNVFDIPTPLNLPPSFIMIIVPLIVALVLAYQEAGKVGLKRLFTPFFTVKGKLWTVFGLVAVPTLITLGYVVSVWLGLINPLPWQLPGIGTILFVLALYFIGAIPEEVGWTMYATKLLQAKYGVFLTGCIIGLVWELWHIIPFVSQGHDTLWIVGQVLFSVALRILMGYVFANTGRGLGLAVVMHTIANAFIEFLPGGVASYNPWMLAILGWATVAIVAKFNTPMVALNTPKR